MPLFNSTLAWVEDYDSIHQRVKVTKISYFFNIIWYKGKKGFFWWWTSSQILITAHKITWTQVPWNTLHCSEIPPLLGGIFHFYPLLPLCTPSQCCTPSTAPIAPSESHLSSNIVTIPTMGLTGGTRKFSKCCDPWELQGPPQAVHRTGPTLRPGHWLTSSISEKSIHDPSKFTYGLKCDKRLHMACSYEEYCMLLKNSLGCVHASKVH